MGSGISVRNKVRDSVNFEASLTREEFQKHLRKITSIFQTVPHARTKLICSFRVKGQPQKKKLAVSVVNSNMKFFSHVFKYQDICEMREAVDVNRSIGWKDFFTAIYNSVSSRSMELDFCGQKDTSNAKVCHMKLELGFRQTGRIQLVMKLKRLNTPHTELRSSFLFPLYQFYRKHASLVSLEKMEYLEKQICNYQHKIDVLEEQHGSETEDSESEDDDDHSSPKSEKKKKGIGDNPDLAIDEKDTIRGRHSAALNFVVEIAERFCSSLSDLDRQSLRHLENYFKAKMNGADPDLSEEEEEEEDDDDDDDDDGYSSDEDRENGDLDGKKKKELAKREDEGDPQDSFLSFLKKKFSKQKKSKEDSFDDDVDFEQTNIGVHEFIGFSRMIKNTKIRHDIVRLFNRVDDWNFDVFKMDQLSGGHSLFITAFVIFIKLDFFRRFEIPESTFMSFLNQVEMGYHANPYHNSRHATDVVQVLNSIFQYGKQEFEKMFHDEHFLASLVAAMIHDLDHPGLNNRFHVGSASYLAILYNDRSILENHHVAQAFEIMRIPTCNIFKSLPVKKRRKIRKCIIEEVLATDMAMHDRICNEFRVFLQFYGDNKNELSLRNDVEHQHSSQHSESFEDSGEENWVVLKIAIKMADVSNPARPTFLYIQWAKALLEENAAQGEKEKMLGLQLSVYSSKSNVKETQIAFIENIITPMFKMFSFLVPKLSFTEQHIRENTKFWQTHDDFKDDVIRRLIREERKRRDVEDGVTRKKRRRRKNRDGRYYKRYYGGKRGRFGDYQYGKRRRRKK